MPCKATCKTTVNKVTPTAKMKVSREITETEGASANKDALPQSDHREVETLLAQYRTADSDDETRPMQRIFHPACRESTRNETSGAGSCAMTIDAPPDATATTTLATAVPAAAASTAITT
jgi:hypothetical protein